MSVCIPLNTMAFDTNNIDRFRSMQSETVTCPKCHDPKNTLGGTENISAKQEVKNICCDCMMLEEIGNISTDQQKQTLQDAEAILMELLQDQTDADK